MNIATVTLIVVFVLIAARRIGPVPIAIWQAMTAGALVVLATGAIRPGAALAAVDLDVMGFLFGVFIIAEALIRSGVLAQQSARVFAGARSTAGLLARFMGAVALGSALLMNDTIAIVATPLALALARARRLDPRLLLLALAFAVTTGSVLSPIGNPQNLLIAIRAGLPAPFQDFIAALAVPTLLNLALCALILRAAYPREFRSFEPVAIEVTPRDPALARHARLALGALLAAIAVKITAIGSAWGDAVRLSTIAFAGAVPLLALSARRLELVRGVDWRTLVFFAAMFVLMAAVWNAGSVSSLVPTGAEALASPGVVLGFSVLVSQLVSNVPLVALTLPAMAPEGSATPALMALAAGSTIAGNMLILGAASNVIILQRAEREGATVTFLEFARLGVPLTLAQTALYWVWFEFLYGP